jgi:TPR repeat protein
MTAQARFASSPFAIPTLYVFLLCVTLPAAAKNDWQSDFRQWVLSSQTNPNCKILYTTGIYRSDLGDKPQWGFMSENMFRWFSKEGVKIAPSVCPVTQKDIDKVKYRVLVSETPMKTVSQTTHSSETRTTTEPFSADVSSHTTYSDGSSANGTATVQGQQTSTIVVPTETTVSQSSVALYMYAYRVKRNQLELISTDSVVFSRVTASGSGDEAATAELGAGIGNLIRASGDRHRADKLFEEALKAIRADAQDNATKTDAMPETSSQVAVPVATVVPSAAPVSAQTPVSIDSAEPAQSIDTLKEQTPSGDVKAQFDLGMAYYNGQGVTQDFAQAIVWYRRAAEQGNSDAQFYLGVSYGNGLGVPRDYVQAAVWLRKAAEHGQTPAQCVLGLMYAAGLGVPLDYEQAATWLRKAAEQGDAKAQDNLANLYKDGQGVSRDYTQAAVWFRKAAEQGDMNAQQRLGEFYGLGRGVPQDYAEAYFWFDIAASKKVEGVKQEDIAKERDGMADLLTPADLSRVQERARRWFEDHPAKPQ